MKEINLTILGKPIAKQRPRFFRRGDYVGTYNNQETEEGRWIWEARNQLPYDVHHNPLTGPIILRATFIMPITKAFSKAKIQTITNGVWIPHIKRPDLDNLIKWVKDCLNGWLWKDDSQVYQIKSTKRYGMEAMTKIEIIEIGN